MNQEERIQWALELTLVREKPFNTKATLLTAYKQRGKRLDMIRRLLDESTTDEWFDDNMTWIKAMIPRERMLEMEVMQSQAE